MATPVFGLPPLSLFPPLGSLATSSQSLWQALFLSQCPHIGVSQGLFPSYTLFLNNLFFMPKISSTCWWCTNLYLHFNLSFVLRTWVSNCLLIQLLLGSIIGPLSLNIPKQSSRFLLPCIFSQTYSFSSPWIHFSKWWGYPLIYSNQTWSCCPFWFFQ